VKIQPASPGQPDVEHKTSRTVRAAAPEESLNRGEQLDTQAYRSEQTLKPLAYLFIVVDDDNSRLLGIRDEIAEMRVFHGPTPGVDRLGTPRRTTA
jgi:hypothetical protein